MRRRPRKEVVISMPDATTAGGGWDRRRWLILGVIALAQLTVVLDLTVMNVALPSARRALGFSTVDRQWVVTAYSLAFGSLLLLGGRLADLLGRKVTFLAGLAGFAGVSAIGGASVNFAMLVTARACQGAFAALLVPSALSLLTTIVLMPRFGPKPLVASGMLAAAGGAAWLAQLGPHTGYAAGVLGPIILAAAGLGLVIAPVINTGTFGVAPQDAGVASATATVGQQLGASIGTSLLNTIFAAAVTSYLAAHLTAARVIGRQALTGLALAHGYDVAFWWTAGIFAGGAVIGGALLRPGPLRPPSTPPPAHTDATTAQAQRPA
jgi:Major Facilitator Superfamily